MDKQILFYNSDYQFYYSPKSKTISSPQISGKQDDDYSKNWVICFGLVIVYWISLPLILPLILMTNIFCATLIVALTCILIRMFFKVKTYFHFSLKWLWYLFFVTLYFFGWFLTTFTFAFSEIKMSTDSVSVIYGILFIVCGICINYKKSFVLTDEKKYVTTLENKKKLRDVLISNDINYKVIIILEAVVMGVFAIYILTGGINYMASWFLPSVIVAVFQRNIYYLFLIHKIAKQYGISLKSKDVLAENDAEAEKQINAENKANEENGTNIKNVSSTENEINAEINTAKEIVTENKATAKNETNSETNIKSDTNTNTEN